MTQKQTATQGELTGIYSFVGKNVEKTSDEIYQTIQTSPLDQGFITVVFGPCCSGKSQVAINLFQSLSQKTKRSPILTQPSADRTDTPENTVFSRSGITIDATSFHTKQDIERIFHDHDIVIMDEIQFIPAELQSSLLREIKLFNDRGGIFIGMGLEYNSQAAEFVLPALLKHRAKYVYNLIALCNMCGQRAKHFNQRLINGTPASVDTPDLLQPSDIVTYEPRCSDCLVIKR
jgi:thymidine kinase